ncbi:hypothetical protein EDD17DRAFT_1507294 [Pisolithus thermaeus]|nr:hypothetical protein EDD17DRAFT_1507294 [Pisolithus thermaeus]
MNVSSAARANFDTPSREPGIAKALPRGYPLYGLAERKTEKKEKTPTSAAAPATVSSRQAAASRLRNAADTRPMMIYLMITASTFMKLDYTNVFHMVPKAFWYLWLACSPTLHVMLRGVDEWTCKSSQPTPTVHSIASAFHFAHHYYKLLYLGLLTSLLIGNTDS